MLTPADLRSNGATGYRYVKKSDAKTSKGHGGGLPFQAQAGDRRPGGNYWFGPRRATALEAACDYCDHVNSGQAPKGRMLRRANHPVRRSPVTKKQTTATKQTRKPHSARTLRGSVYLIGIKGNTSAVKVGFSSAPGFPRLNELQTGNPYLLVGIAEFAGTLRDEYDLHVRYEPDNMLNEWFRASDELLSEFDLTRDEFEEAVSLG